MSNTVVKAACISKQMHPCPLVDASCRDLEKNVMHAQKGHEHAKTELKKYS